MEHLPKDCPVDSQVRVTLIHQTNGKSKLRTDSGHDSTPPPDVTGTWTGATIFQINGETRKELAMYTGHQQHQHFTSAKQQAKEQKLAKMKKFKQEKNAVNERLLGPHERAMFKEAKVKELKSFFDHHVWVFETTKEADPARTLTSRILLKWSRNPDGTPRAKARLIETSSPTTTRLSRSVVLSLGATMGWTTWTADVSTAFLQGREQERKLWVKLPACKFAKALRDQPSNKKKVERAYRIGL